MRTTFTIAAIAALLALSPIAAQAAVECKAAVPGSGFSDSQAWEGWGGAVASKYGPEWADLSLARHKSSSEINLGLAITFLVSAEPCRVRRISADLLNNAVNAGTLQVQQEPAKPKGVFSQHKLGVSFN